jgi:hypothetical protein
MSHSILEPPQLYDSLLQSQQALVDAGATINPVGAGRGVLCFEEGEVRLRSTKREGSSYVTIETANSQERILISFKIRQLLSQIPAE